MTGPGDSGLPQAMQDLQASRERLLAVVAGVTEEQFKRRPAVEHEAQAGDWSIAEVLAHLLASEQRQGTRLDALLSGGAAPVREPDEEARIAEARQGRAVPVPQIIHGLLASRRYIERRLTQPDAERVSDTVLQVLREDVIRHETEHARQIEAVKSALGAARAGRSGTAG